jgi:small GTP-binding protein
MWDNNVKTFENIIQLIKTIKDCLKNKNNKNIPFILLQNKNDLNLDYGRPSNQDNDNDNDNNIDIEKSIEDIKKEIPNFIFKTVSLLNKDDLSNILLEIDRNIDRTEVENKNDVIDLVKVDYPINQLKDDNEILNEIKISLLGDSNTGKTSFLNIISKESIKNMTSTLGLEDIIFYAYIKNKKYKIKIMDTAGQENYRSITSSYIKDKDGFLLFFDVTNKDSYESIDFWMNFINDNNLSKEIILLGNKIDKSDIRDVKKNEVKEYAKNNDIKYIECCCKAHINIYEILNEIILMSFNRFQEKENRNSVGLKNETQSNWLCRC